MISSLDYVLRSALDDVALTLAISIVQPSVNIVKQLHFPGQWMDTPVDEREKFFLNRMQSFIWWNKKFRFSVVITVLVILQILVAVHIYYDYNMNCSAASIIAYLSCVFAISVLDAFAIFLDWRRICKDVATFEKLFLVYRRAREHVMARGQSLVKSRLFTESYMHLDEAGLNAFWRSVPEIDEFLKFYD